MSCEAEASKAIKDRGLRVTAPRMRVLSDLMHAGSHLSARDVVRRVSRHRADTTASTVYRTLSTLRDARLVSETLMADGETIYEAAVSGSHHHIECKTCGAVSDVDAGYFAELRQQLRQDYGFEAELDHLAIKGHCANCREAS